MDPRYSQFFDLFNAREFFEAHEVLESLWREEKGPDRNFYQGLIQIAAAFVHVQNGNAYGTQSLLDSAAKYLSDYPPLKGGLDLPKLLESSRRAAVSKTFPQFRPILPA